MVRTQIQLTDEQLDAVRRLAQREGSSVADVVRRAVDAMLANERGASRAVLRQRAIAVTGRFASGQRDVSRDHDRHLADAFRE